MTEPLQAGIYCRLSRARFGDTTNRHRRVTTSTGAKMASDLWYDAQCKQCRLHFECLRRFPETLCFWCRQPSRG